MGLFDQQQQPMQGLMGLGQQPQQKQPQYMMPFNQPSTFDISQNAYSNAVNQQAPSGGTNPSFEEWSNQQMNRSGSGQENFMGQPQGNMPPQSSGFSPFDSQGAMPQYEFGVTNPFINQGAMPQNRSTFGDVVVGNKGFKPDVANNQFNLGYNPPEINNMQQPRAMQAPQAMQAQQPPQFFQPQSMQQQPSNPVNTQSVQPNFMGQTPFGQAQTGQFTSTNPFVQAAQANAQGNIAGALQATAANRINQQTPYGSLSYQQTGTDAQGNPIWSANQNLSPELQNLTQSSLAGLQASQANPMYGINPGDTYSNAIMQRLAPQQKQQTEALDAQLANQGIMPGSEAYNRAKTLLGQTQNDALTSAIVGGMQTGLQAQNLQNTTAANIRNLATPGYVTPYNQAAVAGPDYLSAYTSQNATEIARQNAEAAQRSAMLGGLMGLGSSAILGGTGANSTLGGLFSLGQKGLDAIGGSGLWNQLFGSGGSAITGDKDFLKSIGLDNTFYGSGTGGMLTDPLAGLYTQPSTPEDLSYLFNSSFGYDF
jgi:hypothetical protein